VAKQKFNITNRATYNKALINRGSLKFWLDESVIQAWYNEPKISSRGRPQRYSELPFLPYDAQTRFSPHAARFAGIY